MDDSREVMKEKPRQAFKLFLVISLTDMKILVPNGVARGRGPKRDFLFVIDFILVGGRTAHHVSVHITACA